MIGTQQYRRMESSCASAPPAKGSGNIGAAGKTEEPETTASNLARTLVMGRRLEDVGPVRPAPSEPEHQQVRQAEAGQPAAVGVRDVS